VAKTGATALSTLISAFPEVVPGTTAGSDSLSNRLSGTCVNCVLPSVGSQEITAEVGMHTLRLNGRHETGGTISPEFLLSGDYSVYKFFKAWAGLAASHDDDVNVVNSLLLASINVSSLDVSNNVTNKVNLENVWCRNCPEISYSDDSNDIIRFAPELVYEFAPQGAIN